jgi:DNA-binding NtrC family response regulator
MNETQLQMKNDDPETETEITNEAQVTAEQSGGPVDVARTESAPSGVRVTLRTLRAETEMQAISQALQQTGWNRKRAAQLLSISYRGLLYKIRQHNITRDQGIAGVPKRPKMADTLDNWESSSLAVAAGGVPNKD